MQLTTEQMREKLENWKGTAHWAITHGTGYEFQYAIEFALKLVDEIEMRDRIIHDLREDAGTLYMVYYSTMAYLDTIDPPGVHRTFIDALNDVQKTYQYIKPNSSVCILINRGTLWENHLQFRSRSAFDAYMRNREETLKS